MKVVSATLAAVAMAEEKVRQPRIDGFGHCTELPGDGAYHLDYEIEEIS